MKGVNHMTTAQCAAIHIKSLINPDTGKIRLYDLLRELDDLQFETESADALLDELLQCTPLANTAEHIKESPTAQNLFVGSFSRIQTLLYTVYDYIRVLKCSLAELVKIEVDMIVVPADTQHAGQKTIPDAFEIVNTVYDAQTDVGNLRQLLLAVYDMHFDQREDRLDDGLVRTEIMRSYLMSKSIISTALELVMRADETLERAQKMYLGPEAVDNLSSKALSEQDAAEIRHEIIEKICQRSTEDINLLVAELEDYRHSKSPLASSPTKEPM